VGVITQRDVKQFAPSLLTRITPDEYNQVMEKTPLARVMTRNPMTVRPDQSAFEAANLLYSKRVGCLPVVENGELVGILTTTDMLKLLVRLLERQNAGSGNLPAAS
jgi:CBS domain-containing protein